MTMLKRNRTIKCHYTIDSFYTISPFKSDSDFARINPVGLNPIIFERFETFVIDRSSYYQKTEYSDFNFYRFRQKYALGYAVEKEVDGLGPQVKEKQTVYCPSADCPL